MSEEEPSVDASTQQPSASWFPSIPQPIKTIFDQFPLTTYPSNQAPLQYSTRPNEPRLYVFTTPEDARLGLPSINPQCLKWQTYLKFTDIEFRTVPSNNHASPNGVLPFLLPPKASTEETDVLLPIPSTRLQKWADAKACIDEDIENNMRLEAYSSLLDGKIRDAWLYTSYLNSPNFNSITRKAYILPSTSNSIVRKFLSYQLQSAARDQLTKTSPYIDADDLLAEAKRAFDSLSILLGNDEYFFGQRKPGLFDASVFAYTHLILDEKLGWKHNLLAVYLKQNHNLVQHRDRLLETYF
ncbi:hypothetical protein FQN57_004063 [Myotisia sp. PD_48]|nr:hypothetical protein FQN57_004063 [Myotisia sp. PD_48]